MPVTAGKRLIARPMPSVRAMAVTPALSAWTSNCRMNPRMTLILRALKKHMGWEDAKDDYVVLDGEKSVGRVYKEHGAKWFWSVNTSPYPAPPPNNGLAKSLEPIGRGRAASSKKSETEISNETPEISNETPRTNSGIRRRSF
jgi:hypothetical protein